jgi:excisionase family DNA binding protein
MVAEKLLNGNDIAERLDISKSLAYKLMKTEIPTIRFGRTVRVRPEDLEQFISKKSKQNDLMFTKDPLKS